VDVLVIGQSNASNWLHDITFSSPAPGTFAWSSGAWRTARGEGTVSFSSAIANATGDSVRVLNAAEGSTSLLPIQGANWLATGSGSLYGHMLAAVRASGLHPDAILWIQGEKDAASGVSSAAYLSGLNTLFDRLERDFGDAPVFLQPLILPQPGMQAINSAQQAFVASHDHATLLPASVELLTRDQVHFTVAGYNVLGDLAARAVLSELSLPSPRPSIYGNASANTLNGGGLADRIYARSGNDTLNGNSGNDVLLGEQGNDRLLGGGGNDLLSGGSGNDVLNGGAGNDRLFGDTGDDRLYGKAGRDTLTGGPGRDVFVITREDVITDFSPGDSIVIDASPVARLHYDELLAALAAAAPDLTQIA
jgi:hypothetical protein